MFDAPLSDRPTWPPPLARVEPVEPAGPDGRRGGFVAALVVLALVSGAVGFAISWAVRDNSSTATAAAVLRSLVVQPSDVAAADEIQLFGPDGDKLTAPTLDLCNGRFPSEVRRTNRLQVVQVHDGSRVFSTEAVLYRDAASTVQAFDEIRRVRATCPPRPVPSPVGEQTVTTTFNAPPDRSWPHVARVDRLAYDIETVSGATSGERSIVVYLRRGRAFLGLYFAQPIGVQAGVGGRTTVAGIVALFESRLAGLPKSAVR